MIPLSLIFLIIAAAGVLLSFGNAFRPVNFRSENAAPFEKSILFWFVPFAIIAIIFAAFNK